MRTNRIAIILVILVALVSAFFLVRYLWNRILLPMTGVKDEIAEIVAPEVNTPGPLRAVEESEQSYLTKSGIIKSTNIQRNSHGLEPLKENQKLDQAAKIKAQDMFDHQYFAHDSPTGEGADDLAREVNYQFLVIGENLALGNFVDDQVLVQAWMDSPGHRANILNTSYQEIGVAAVRGTYKGERTWIAVQHFGLSQSICDQPDQTIKSEIDINNQKMVQLQNEIKQLETEIRTLKGSERNKKVGEYNRKVEEYNSLADRNKALTARYNIEVQEYNNCVRGIR